MPDFQATNRNMLEYVSVYGSRSLAGAESNQQSEGQLVRKEDRSLARR